MNSRRILTASKSDLLYLGYLLARLIARTIPLGVALGIARAIGAIWYAANRRLRANLDANLSVVPALARDPSTRARLARANVKNFSEVVTEFLYLPTIAPAELDRYVDLASVERLKAMAGGHPALFVTPHVGNWELAAAAVAMTGVRLQVIVYDHPDKRIAAMFRRRREEKGLTVMSVKSAARNLAVALETTSVGLAGDRDYTGHGAPASLFGTPVRVPSAYAGLALSAAIDVIPACCVRHADGIYYIESDGPVSREGVEDPMDLVAACLRRFEKYIEKYPEQWYLFEKLGD